MEDCVFCKIIKAEIPADFVYQDEDLVAFRDIKPVAPVHILIVPQKHLSSLNEASEPDQVLLGKMLLVAKKIAQQQGVDQTGYRLSINTGRDSGQVVFHLHIHLLGGWKAEQPIN